MTSRHNRSRQLIESSAAREGAKLDIRLELESAEPLQQLLPSGRIYGLLPYSSVSWRRRPGGSARVPIQGLTMTRYLAKSRTEANSIARETLEKVTLAEMRALGKTHRHARGVGAARRTFSYPPLEGDGRRAAAGWGEAAQRNAAAFKTPSPHPVSHLAMRADPRPPGEGGHSRPHSGISHGVENTLW